MKSLYEMTPEERQAYIDANSPTVSSLHSGQTYFDWSWKGCGFGQLEVLLTKDGDLIAHNECMSRERVRKILHAWADFIADRVVLSDNPEDAPPVDIHAEREQARKYAEEFEIKRARIKR